MNNHATSSQIQRLTGQHCLRTHSSSNLIILSSLSIDLECSVINDFSNFTRIVVFPLCVQHHNFTFPFLTLFPFFLPSSILQFPLHFFLYVFLFFYFILLPQIPFLIYVFHYYQVTQESTHYKGNPSSKKT